MIDRTFKASPKKYYQIINIVGYYEKIKGIVPLFMIPCTEKSIIIYDMIIKDVLEILNQNGIKLGSITKNFMCVFEKALKKIIKKFLKM